jgi:hypothetical protein
MEGEGRRGKVIEGEGRRGKERKGRKGRDSTFESCFNFVRGFFAKANNAASTSSVDAPYEVSLPLSSSLILPSHL